MKNKKLVYGLLGGIGVIGGATAAFFGIKKVLKDRNEILITEDDLFENEAFCEREEAFYGEGDKCGCDCNCGDECGCEGDECGCGGDECGCGEGCGCSPIYGEEEPTLNIADLDDIQDEITVEILEELEELDKLDN